MSGPVDERAGVPAFGADLSGIDVFISHVEEDGAVALELADALDAAGYATWCYERDTIPGPSYLLQTSGAIEGSQAVVVLISADALGSHQVTSEVVRAHEADKPFIPLLIGISREEFGARQPEWREAIGSAATLELPAGGVRAVVPRIVDGLTALGVRPHEPGAPKARLPFIAGQGGADASSRFAPVRRRSRRLLVPGLVVVALAVVVAVVLVLTLGGDDGAPGPSGTASTAIPSVTSPPGAGTKDAATTPLDTLAGPARVTARADTEFCSVGGGACQTAAPGRVFLFLDLAPWQSGTLIYDQNLSTSAFSSHVTFRQVGFTPVETHTPGTGGSGLTVVFPSLPDAVVGADVDLRWPGNPPLRVHVE